MRQHVPTGKESKTASGGPEFPVAGVCGVEGQSGGGGALLPMDTAQLGLWALLGTLTMLFAGFTSAYLVRRAGSDWQAISMPPILWFNTGVLLVSSFTLAAARNAMKRWRTEALQGWLFSTVALGLIFLAGQVNAWQQLAAQGVYLPTSPHSSFVYMLTAVHGLHVVGGLAALFYGLVQVWRSRWTPAGPNPLPVCVTYWHFVDGVWLYLFALLFAW